MSLTAAEIIAQLGLKPHPEGGHYAQTWAADSVAGARPTGTAIYYLLQRGEVSHWHRVDAAEVWHWYDGASLELSMPGKVQVLGRNLAKSERPQILVPPHVWQSALSLGEWTLAGCTVSPGFEFTGFELAPPGWQPHENAT